MLLGVDAGGSGTKWCVRTGETVVFGRTGPMTALLLGTPEGQQTLRKLISMLPAAPEAVQVGLPGLQAGSERAVEIQKLLAAALNLPLERVGMESDLELAFHAHLTPGQGALLYAGTGSIAFGLGVNGEVYRAGGRGYRLGDDGGGFSIGRAALRWVTDALDVGNIPDGVLARELTEVTGGLDWNTLRDFVYGLPGASAVARLAWPVARAAESGDVVALKLLTEAASSVAELARRIRLQVGDPLYPLVATGGVLQGAVLQGLLLEMVPGLTVQFRPHEAEAARRAALLLP